TRTILEHAEWMSAERCVDRAQLPPVAKPLSERTNIRNLVNATQVKVQMNVLIAKAVAILKIRMSQVDTTYRIVVVDLRIVPLSPPVYRIQVKALAPREIVRRINPMPTPLIVRHLHAVVLRRAFIGHGNEMTNERFTSVGISESAGERSQGVAFLG